MDWPLAWYLLRTGIGHQLSPLWQAILFQGSLILADALLGPTSTALWGTLRIVSRSGNQVLELVTLSFGPEFQLALGKGQMNKVRDLHGVGMVVSLFLAVTMGLVVVGIGPFFFKIWTRNVFQVPMVLWVILALGLVPCALWGNSGEVQRLNNQPWALNVWAVFALADCSGCHGCLG